MMDQVTEQKLAQFIDICSNNDFESSSSAYLSAINLLKEIYTDNFRHEYSKIARMLSRPSSGVYTPDQFVCLRDNLSFIENNLQDSDLATQQQESFRKLSDHIQLEAYRIEKVDSRLDSVMNDVTKLKKAYELLGQDDANVRKLLLTTENVLQMSSEVHSKQKEQEKAFEEITQKINESRTVEEELSVKLKSTQEKLKNFDTQSITILSIFSAIVFAFTGGFTMLGSAFTNLTGITRNESSLLIILVLIVGCVLVDIIYFLLHFIGRITGIHVGGGCTLKCEDCASRKKDKTTCSLWIRLTKRHPTIFWANIVIFIVVTLLFLASFFCFTPNDTDAPTNAPSSTYVHTLTEPLDSEKLATVKSSPELITPLHTIGSIIANMLSE